MSGSNKTNQPVAVPQEDGAIEQMLGDLETKMTAWIDAVSHVNEALMQEADVRAQVAQAEAPAPAAAVAEPEVEEVVAEPAVAEPAVTEPAPEPQPVAEKPPEPPAAQEAPTTNDTQASTPQAEDKPESTDSGGQNMTAEDRELLESLDPKLRMEIRIRRRLDSSRSVRELRDEILAQQEAEADQPSSRRWWRRSGNK